MIYIHGEQAEETRKNVARNTRETQTRKKDTRAGHTHARRREQLLKAGFGDSPQHLRRKWPWLLALVNNFPANRSSWLPSLGLSCLISSHVHIPPYCLRSGHHSEHTTKTPLANEKLPVPRIARGGCSTCAFLCPMRPKLSYRTLRQKPRPYFCCTKQHTTKRPTGRQAGRRRQTGTQASMGYVCKNIESSSRPRTEINVFPASGGMEPYRCTAVTHVLLSRTKRARCPA